MGRVEHSREEQKWQGRARQGKVRQGKAIQDCGKGGMVSGKSSITALEGSRAV